MRSSGPNAGFSYLTSVTTQAIYQWKIVPDLANTSSQFYQAQCGNYNATTHPNGLISGVNLAAGTQRHKTGIVSSHWANYKSAQDNTSNNMGVFYEQEVAPPGNTMAGVLNRDVPPKHSTILNAELVEPYAINLDQNGNFLGNINFPPDASCH